MTNKATYCHWITWWNLLGIICLNQKKTSNNIECAHAQLMKWDTWSRIMPLVWPLFLNSLKALFLVASCKALLSTLHRPKDCSNFDHRAGWWWWMLLTCSTKNVEEGQHLEDEEAVACQYPKSYGWDCMQKQEKEVQSESRWLGMRTTSLTCTGLPSIITATNFGRACLKYAVAFDLPADSVVFLIETFFSTLMSWALDCTHEVATLPLWIPSRLPTPATCCLL